MKKPLLKPALGEPLVRIVKRTDLNMGHQWLLRIAAVVLALLAGGVLITALGHNPLAVYADMLRGSFSTATARTSTIKIFIPLLGAALAIAPAFRMKFWNIGAEGQITAGAIAATFFALFLVNSLPRALLLVVMAVAAMLFGGLFALLPAAFKARWGTNETLFTLMLNYIAIGIVKYLRTGPWMNPSGSGFPKIAMFGDAARLPTLFGQHIGLYVVLLLAVGMYFYLNYTKHGYEIAVVGESERTARYAGMRVGKIVMRTMFLSGAIAGLMGYLIACGSTYTLTDGIAGGYGFTAITVAWLAQLNPFVMILITVFLSVLQKGANTIQTDFGIPASASEVLTGLILFCMLGCEFFLRYRLVFRRTAHKEVL